MAWRVIFLVGLVDTSGPGVAVDGRGFWVSRALAGGSPVRGCGMRVALQGPGCQVIPAGDEAADDAIVALVEVGRQQGFGAVGQRVVVGQGGW